MAALLKIIIDRLTGHEDTVHEQLNSIKIQHWHDRYLYRPEGEDMIERLRKDEKGSKKKSNVEGKKYDWSRRSGIDRRSGMDRRQIQNLNRAINDESQRRNYMERRKSDELRIDWARISAWSSMYIGRT